MDLNTDPIEMDLPEGSKLIARTRSFQNLKPGDLLFVANGLHVVKTEPVRDDLGRLSVTLDGSNTYSSERDDQAILVWERDGFMGSLGL